MAQYALMAGNTVGNIIVADNKTDAEQALHCTLIEITSDNPAGIGWTYDEETGRFVEPEQETNEQP